MKRNKTKTVAVRLTDLEYQFLQHKAESKGLNISQLMRRAVMVESSDRIVPEVNRLTYQRLGQLQESLPDLEPNQRVEVLEREIRQLRLEVLGLKG